MNDKTYLLFKKILLTILLIMCGAAFFICGYLIAKRQTTPPILPGNPDTYIQLRYENSGYLAGIKELERSLSDQSSRYAELEKLTIRREASERASLKRIAELEKYIGQLESRGTEDIQAVSVIETNTGDIADINQQIRERAQAGIEAIKSGESENLVD